MHKAILKRVVPLAALVSSCVLAQGQTAAEVAAVPNRADGFGTTLLTDKKVSMTAQELVTVLKRSADWQLANPHGRTPITDWVAAPLYDGLLRLAFTTGDERYLAAVINKGRQAGWMPQYELYFADDIAVGHAWLDVYELDRSRAERLKPMKDRLDAILAKPITEKLNLATPKAFPQYSPTDRWTWCDALYMGPATWIKLYRATGDKRYLQFMDSEFKFSYDNLWDREEKLFFRDGNFLDKKAPNGRKVFWSRGNGWVMGGLCLMLEDLPKEHPTRPFYEKLLQEMASSVVKLQGADGLWRPSLLDPKQVDIGETSGTGFYVFALAWGINHGYLDRAQYWPAVESGMRGLLTRVKPDGYVGYVQRIGLAPDSVSAESRQDYGTGAFLLAGCEVLRAIKGDKPVADLKSFLAKAEALSVNDTPRAYARMVPERKDDIAFENDKVAFRIYGPALRDSIEASGIDLWCKRTAKPVIDRWYPMDIAGTQSYHKDHGEGYDVYKVADSLGCGGLGVWHGGKLYIPDTYERPRVYDTTRDEAKVTVLYVYPKIGDMQVTETRTIVLRMGEQLMEISSHFNVKGGKLSDFEVAAGLFTQTEKPEVVQDTATGATAVWESIDGEGLGLGLAVAPANVVGMKRLPFGDKREHALVVMKLDAKGDVRYRAGFAWTKAGEIKSLQAWKKYLEGKAK